MTIARTDVLLLVVNRTCRRFISERMISASLGSLLASHHCLPHYKCRRPRADGSFAQRAGNVACVWLASTPYSMRADGRRSAYRT